jgi:hypothetical protein
MPAIAEEMEPMRATASALFVRSAEPAHVVLRYFVGFGGFGLRRIFA